MEPIIQFTLSQVWALVLSICGGVTIIAGAITVIIKIINVAKKPNETQNERLDLIEQRLNLYDEYFKNDKSRLEAIEEGNKVTQKSLLALLSHGIDGNDIIALKTAKSELEHYLISR